MNTPIGPSTTFDSVSIGPTKDMACSCNIVETNNWPPYAAANSGIGTDKLITLKNNTPKWPASDKARLLARMPPKIELMATTYTIPPTPITLRDRSREEIFLSAIDPVAATSTESSPQQQELHSIHKVISVTAGYTSLVALGKIAYTDTKPR